jgi:hypothetical protein
MATHSVSTKMTPQARAKLHRQLDRIIDCERHTFAVFRTVTLDSIQHAARILEK